MRFLILFAFLFSLELIARPPADLIFPSGTSFQKRKKRLTDKDIIFTDVGTLTPQEKINQAISGKLDHFKKPLQESIKKYDEKIFKKSFLLFLENLLNN